MEIIPLKTHTLASRFDLFDAIRNSLQKNKLKLRGDDILVLSSKAVALSEGRMEKFTKNLIRREADKIFDKGKIPLTLKHHILIPAAGVDRSNVPEGYAIGWPKKPEKSAEKILAMLKERFHMRRCGVVICDSHCQPLRWGVTGIAIAWAGFLGVEDYRGKKDIFGKKLKVTRKAVADNLASAALLVMGEAAEKIPFAIIRGAPVEFTNRIQKPAEIFVKPTDCLFRNIYSRKFMKMVKSRS